MLKAMILAALFATICAEYQAYQPRGWRPAGRPFDEPFRGDRLQTSYGAPPLPRTLYDDPPRRPEVARDPEPPTRRRTTTEAPRTTTPRSREPTTSPDLDDDQDYDANPVLAVANSFAFNRPIYVYNAFPYHPGLTFVK